MNNTELFKRIVEAGIPYNNHSSDLYIPVTDQTKELLKDYDFPSNVTTFRSQIDGKMKYDIPFAYQPFWDARERKRIGN